MKNFLFLLITITLLPSYALSQELIFSKKIKRNSIPIRYNRNEPSAYINAMLDTLASGSQNRRGLIFFYDTELKVIKQESGLLNFIVGLGGIKHRGNTNYRNFSLTDVMIPNKASFIIDWYSGTEERIHTINIEETQLNREKMELINYPQKDSLKMDNYNIRTKGFVFHFDEENWMDFKFHIDVIDEYYRDFDSVQSKIKYLQTTNFSSKRLRGDTIFLPKASRFVHNTKAFIRDIQSKVYSELVPAPGAKIPDLMVHLDILNETNKQIYDSVQNVISDNYNNVTKNIENFIHRQQFTEAQEVITQQLFPLGLYGVGNYYLSEIYFLQNKTEFSRKKMVLLAQKFALDEPILKKSQKLTMRINRVILSNAKKEINNNNIDQSVLTLNKASELLTLFDGAIDLVKHDPTLKSQLKAIQQNYVNHGLKQFEIGDYESAISWYKSASDICDNFGVNLCGEALTKQILESKKEFQNKIIATGLQNIQDYDLASAEARINEEQRFRKSNNLQKPELAKQMEIEWATKKLMKNQKEGNKSLVEKRYKLAMDTLYHAKVLAKKFNFETVDCLDSLLFHSCLRYLDRFIAHKDSFATINPAEIELIIEQISDIKSVTNSATGMKIDKQVAILHQMQLAACDYQSSEFGKYFNAATTSIKSASFLVADSLLQVAIGITSEYESCEIDPIEAFRAKQGIAFGVGYELALDKIINSIQKQNYPDAIDQYESLTQYYNVYRLSDLGLAHDSLQTFVANTDDIMFINFCIGQFSDLDNFETALYLLNNLYIRGINSELSRNGQIALGIILATNDFQQNSGRPVKEMIERYTNGDKWFEHFERVYEIRWDKLRKSK